MDINRSNYEIWLTDLLDGNLNNLQITALMAFLEANPDLKEDYEGLSRVHINKTSAKFSRKSLLKKTTSVLTDSQFEYLCIAHLEKDLVKEQEEELLEIINTNSEREKLFHLFQKMVLLQPKDKYPGRKALKKNLPVKVSASLYIGLLSSAALVAFVIYSALLFRKTKSENEISLTVNTPDSLEIKASAPVHMNKASGKTLPELIIPPAEKKIRIASTNHNAVNRDTIADYGMIHKVQVKDFLSTRTDFYNIQEKELMDWDPEIILPDLYEDRSRVGSFLARKYRDIILKEEHASDKPIKGYEIAEGGIKGLNKILGWEMALQKNNDENGNLRSVNFSSKMLKISAPVKNNQP